MKVARIEITDACANDCLNRFGSFDELMAYEKDRAIGLPVVIVPASTYPTWVSPLYKTHAPEHSFDEAIRPTVMRGAWWRIVSKYGTYCAFRDEVIDRFLRMKKATILSRRDAEKWNAKIIELMFSLDKEKRCVYRWARNYGSIYIGSRIFHKFSKSEMLCWINGVWTDVNDDQMAVIKCLLRHQKKISNIEEQMKQAGVKSWQ